MNSRTIKLIELGALTILAIALLVCGLIALKSAADGEVLGMFIGGVFTVLPLVIQAIRNIPQGDAMNRMVDHLARSQPLQEEAALPKEGNE